MPKGCKGKDSVGELLLRAWSLRTRIDGLTPIVVYDVMNEDSWRRNTEIEFRWIRKPISKYS